MILSVAFAGHALSAPIFSDNFDASGPPTLNWSGGANWNVTSGTVDLIGNGFFDFLPGNGLYVDLDGSTSQAGVLSTTMMFAPGSYIVTFSLAGSQRGSSETVTVSLGSWSTTIANIPSNQPFTVHSYVITTATTGSLSFSNAGNDNVGALLDNVSVSFVPEPISLVVFSGLMVSGWVAVRRRKAVTA
jgi:hypothetical protein